MRHTIESIGRVVSPYTQKFGIARQPGLVPAAEVSIVLDARFNEDAVRGLENFGRTNFGRSCVETVEECPCSDE